MLEKYYDKTALELRQVFGSKGKRIESEVNLGWKWHFALAIVSKMKQDYGGAVTRKLLKNLSFVDILGTLTDQGEKIIEQGAGIMNLRRKNLLANNRSQGKRRRKIQMQLLKIYTEKQRIIEAEEMLKNEKTSAGE